MGPTAADAGHFPMLSSKSYLGDGRCWSRWNRWNIAVPALASAGQFRRLSGILWTFLGLAASGLVPGQPVGRCQGGPGRSQGRESCRIHGGPRPC